MNIENPIVQSCVEQIQRALPGIPVLISPSKKEGCALIHLKINPPLRLRIEVKKGMSTRSQALHCIIQRKEKNTARETLLFTDGLSDSAAMELKRAGMSYVDTMGKIHLWKPPVLMINLDGIRPKKSREGKPGRLMEPGSLKVVHYFLFHPPALGETYREVAAGAGVSLGTAYAVIRELSNRQWLLPATQKSWRWGNRDGLLDKFVEGYALKLRPSLFIGRYRHILKSPQKVLEAFARRLAGSQGKWALTGGMAARELTHHLEPDNLTIFVDEKAEALLNKEPLLRDDTEGNIVLLRILTPSYNYEKSSARWPVAPPLLVYAELLQDGRPREGEMAEIIFNLYLREKPHGA